ncbi:MAG: hypothetical protein ACRDFW_01390 [bacterium]
MSTRKTYSRILSLLLSLIAALVSPQIAQGQSTNVTISLDTIRIVDEDDPVSNDEPYLVVTGFVVQAACDPASGICRPILSTVAVANNTCGHNTLHPRDNWADEPNTYPIPASVGVVSRDVPLNQPLWIVGASAVLMEEDGFSPETARTACESIRDAVQNAVSNFNFTGFNASSVSTAVALQLLRALGDAFRRLDLGGIVRGIASIADPDDFGGVNLILAVTLPGNQVAMLAGDPARFPTTAAALPATPPPPGPFTLRYPVGDLSRIPSRMRFQGDYRVNGNVRVISMPGFESRVGGTATIGSFAGEWESNFAALSLAQTGSAVTGTYTRYGGRTGRIEGTVTGNTLTGTWAIGGGRGPVSLTLDEDGRTFSGNYNGTFQWCGGRPGVRLRDGCGFGGRWNLQFQDGAIGEASLEQIGRNVSGSYRNITAGYGGTVAGTVTEWTVNGTWITALRGSFVWQIQGPTFRGRFAPGAHAWCGWRDGASPPSSCGL